jgi:hypothetical protein
MSTPRSRFRAPALLALLLLLLSWPFIVVRADEQRSGAAAVPDALSRVYFPLVGLPSQAPGLEPQPSPSGGLFLNTASWSYNATLVVDSSGGIHAAYFATGETANGVGPAYYAYCPAQPVEDCLQREAWSQIALAEHADDVQIALTPGGQPRVLISPEPDGRGAPIRYGACDSQCTDPSRWTVATVASTAVIGVGNSSVTAQSFALDHLGRPRFIYTDDRAGMDHAGTFFASCDQDCTRAEGWSEVQIDEERVDGPVLRFDPSGRPHILARAAGENGGSLFYATYAEPLGWSAVNLGPVGSGERSWAMQLDAAGRPRVAFYQGHLDSGSGERVLFLACDDRCGEEVGWRVRNLGLPPGDGRFLALAVDRDGQPRVAYSLPSAGLGLAWCDDSCAAPEGQWRTAVLEAEDEVVRGVQPLPNCTSPQWQGAFAPAISLDSYGNLRATYDGELIQVCRVNPRDPSDTRTRLEKVFHAVRLVIAPRVRGSE